MISIAKQYLKKRLPDSFKRPLRNFLSLRRNISNYIVESKLKLIIFGLSCNNFLNSISRVILAGKFEYRIFSTIEDAAKTNSNEIKFLSKKKISLFFCAPVFDLNPIQKSPLTEVKGHELYSVRINEATVIGGSNLILLSSKRTLYDLHKYNFQNRYRYTDAGILYHNNHGCIVKSNISPTVYQSAIHLGGNFSYNYYHLIYEILVKFQLVNDSEIDSGIPILVDKICFEIPQFIELFTIFNKKKRTLICLNKGERYLIKQLYYFSSPNFIPPNFKEDNRILPEDILFNINSLTYLRDCLIPFASNNTFPKRIFISRSKASDRRKFNEDEVLEIFSRYGFVAVYPENITIADQIAMFSNAEFIAGGSGAAFTNLVFCSNFCKIIIFSKNNLPFTWFSTITTFVGAELIYFTEEKYQSNINFNLHESFQINTSRLNDFISRWVSKEKHLRLIPAEQADLL